MPLFRPIRSESDLPNEGSACEEATCDFKTWYEPERRYEVAKDVAAFANATGGVLLVGAADLHERLVRYLPRPQGDADELRKIVNEVVKDRCIPSPAVEAVVIAKGSGCLLVINVFGFPGQPVGIRVTPQKEHGKDKIGDAYVFPVRTLTGTRFLGPKELATLMLPEIRRRAIELDGIPSTERDVTLMWSQGRSGYANKPAKLIDVDGQVLVALFSVEQAGVVSKLDIPLDQIASIRYEWNGSSRRWSVDLKGSVEPLAGSSQFRWQPHYL